MNVEIHQGSNMCPKSCAAPSQIRIGYYTSTKFSRSLVSHRPKLTGTISLKNNIEKKEQQYVHVVNIYFPSMYNLKLFIYLIHTSQRQWDCRMITNRICGCCYQVNLKPVADFTALK